MHAHVIKTLHGVYSVFISAWGCMHGVCTAKETDERTSFTSVVLKNTPPQELKTLLKKKEI